MGLHKWGNRCARGACTRVCNGVGVCEKGAVGARAKVHKRAYAGARTGHPRVWVCKEVGLHGDLCTGSGVAHRCARLSVQKACEQGASFALGRAKVLHSRVCTAGRCARAECASVCSHEGFCTWILHMDFAQLCVLHAGVIEAGLVLWLLCKVSVRRAHLKGGLDFAQARDLHICKWGG